MKIQKQNRRPPTKVSAHFNKEIARKLEITKGASLHKLYIKSLTENDLEKAWPVFDRKYFDYAKNFDYGIKKHGLGESLFDFLKKRYSLKKESIAVLDLGYGEGHFLAELKKMLKEDRIPSKVEGLSLADNATSENKKLIDKRTNIPATEHVLTKKYDLIVDVWGVFSYSFNSIKKELLLKYAHSLKIGGMLVTNLEYMKGSPKLEFIINHLKKQGFSACFYEKNSESSNSHKYNTLIIQRIK